MADNRRLIFDLDLDNTKFDEKLSKAAKAITDLNSTELEAKKRTLKVLEKIVLANEMLSKAKGLSPEQAAKVNTELQKVEKQYEKIRKAATPPSGKSADPLTGANGKKAIKAIQATQSAYEKFGKAASGNLKDVANEIIKLSKSGRSLELPDQYAEQLGKAEEASQALKIATAALKKENRQLLSTGKDLSEEEEKRLKRNAQEIAKNENLTKKLGLAVRRLKKDYAVIDSANDALEAQQVEIQRLQAQYRALGKAARESAEGEELQRQIQDLTDAYDDANQGIGRYEQNIGNYRSAIIGAATDTEGFGTSISGTIKGIGNATKLLLANPLIAFAAVLALIAGALGKAFLGSERGAEIAQKAFNVLNAVMLVLTRTIDKVIGAVENLSFDSIKESFLSLGTTIKTAVIDRINALLGILGNIRNGEFKKAGKGALELASNMNVVTIAVKGMGGAFDDAKKEIDETTKALNAFDELQRQVTRANARLTVSLALQTAEVDKFTQAADRDTKAWGEREDAATSAGVAIERQSRIQIQLAKNNLSVIQSQFNLAAGTKEQINLEQELADAKAALIEAEAAQIVNREDNNERIAKIVSDRLEIDLDVQLDNFDNIKTLNERKIADETRVFEEKKALLDETRKLGDQAFTEQVKTLNATSKEQIDANEFLNASNSSVFLARLRQLKVSEKFETRALEVFRDRRTAIADLEEAERDLLQAEKERQAQSAANLAESQKKIQELTIENETKRLQFIKASQAQETANAERESSLQIQGIEEKYDLLRKAAQDQADQNLFPKAKLEEYLKALDVLEQKAKEAQNIALQRKVLEINQKALSGAIKSAQAIATSTILTEVDLVQAEATKAISEQFTRGEIDYKEYQARLTAINKKAVADRNSSELKSLEAQLSEIQARVAATQGKDAGLSIFDPEKILNAEDLEKAKKEIERLQAEIAKKGAEIAEGLIPEPPEDPDAPTWVDYYAVIEKAALDTINKITAAEIAALDRSLSIQQQRIDTAKEFFRKGNEDYLAQEEARQTELEQRRERAVRRQQAIDKASQVSSILTGLLREFSSGGITKAGAAFAGISALIGIVSTLIPTPQNFYKGTRFVEGRGGIDQIPANLTRGERVTPADQNKKYMGAYDELEKGHLAPQDALERLQSPIPVFNFDRMTKVVQMESRSNAKLEKQLGALITEQRMTQAAIAGLKMDVSLDADGFAARMRALANRERTKNL